MWENTHGKQARPRTSSTEKGSVNPPSPNLPKLRKDKASKTQKLKAVPRNRSPKQTSTKAPRLMVSLPSRVTTRPNSHSPVVAKPKPIADLPQLSGQAEAEILSFVFSENPSPKDVVPVSVPNAGPDLVSLLKSQTQMHHETHLWHTPPQKQDPR